MEVKIQLLSVYPPFSENDPSTLLFLNDDGGKLYNVQEVLTKQEGIILISSDKIIKCALYKDHDLVGYGEIATNNESKWVNFNKKMSSEEKGEDDEKGEKTQIRIKCGRTELHKSNLSNNNGQSNNKKKKQNEVHFDTKTKTNSIKEALLSPVPLTAKKMNSSSIIPQAQSVNTNNKSQHKSLLMSNGSKQKETHHTHNKTCIDFFDNNNMALLNEEPDLTNTNKSRRTSNQGHRKTTSEKNDSLFNQFVSSHKGQTKRNSSKILSTNSITKRSLCSADLNSTQDNNSNLVKKLEDNFKLIEDKIIDKNFETNICKDEMIIGEKKSLDNCSLESSKSNSSFDELLSRKETKSNFEELKDEFDIFYTNEYLHKISVNLISLELQLCIEKMCILQDAYHNELRESLDTYSQNNDIFHAYREKYMLLNKSMFKLKEKMDWNIVQTAMTSFIMKPKTQQNEEIININKKELILWKMLHQATRKNKENLKNKFIDIFTIAISKNKSKLSIVDEGLCDKIIKKFKTLTEKPVKKFKESSSEVTIRKKRESSVESSPIIHQKLRPIFPSKSNKSGKNNSIFQSYKSKGK